MSILRRRAVFPWLKPPRGPFGSDGAGLGGAADDDEALVEAEHRLLAAFSDDRGEGLRFPRDEGEPDVLPEAAEVPCRDPESPLREADVADL